MIKMTIPSRMLLQMYEIIGNYKKKMGFLGEILFHRCYLLIWNCQKNRIFANQNNPIYVRKISTTSLK